MTTNSVIYLPGRGCSECGRGWEDGWEYLSGEKWGEGVWDSGKGGSRTDTKKHDND